VSRVVALVEVVARALADHPDEVAVIANERRGTTIVEVFMAAGDLGRLIGRQGRTAQALRTLAAIAAERDGVRAQVEFRDGQPTVD
jgi:predicted RNA-binding protein YlqC (UPF0109 family)